MEVCPLSGGVMLSTATQPLSDSLQIGLRFLHLPLPAVPSASLTARFPGCFHLSGELRAYHVPYKYLNASLRFHLSAEGTPSASGELGTPELVPLPFGASLWL